METDKGSRKAQSPQGTKAALQTSGTYAECTRTLE